MQKVVTGDLTFMSLQPLDLSRCNKREIKEYFENSYNLNESIFTSLRDESVFYKLPDRLRLPLIFYYAHTAVVYVNKLVLAGLLQERVNLEFEVLFETGVDEMSWDDTESYRFGGSFKWPSVDKVVEYRRNVRNQILKVIEETPLELPITMESPWWALLMGMEHERIHLETSSVLIRQLPIELVRRPADWVYGPVKSGQSVTENPFIRIEGKVVSMGKPWDFPSYGWDNEYGEVECYVPTFEATKYLITNRQFLEFVNSGGYAKKEFWKTDGWKWREFRKTVHPIFWVCEKGCRSGCGCDLESYTHCKPSNANGNCENGYENDTEIKYRYRAVFDVIDLPLDWPVEVNCHEAQAFCTWMGADYRLPAEVEHHLMRGARASSQAGTRSDIIFWSDPKANINLKYGSSTPVNMHPPTSQGFCDVSGNVWEWVADDFNGLNGFNTHWLYDDFSSPCFDGKHTMIMGGSWISTGDEASYFARFAFRKHFFQHLGFRVARSVSNRAQDYVKTPIRHVTNSVFVLGAGDVEDLPEKSKLAVEYVPTTNIQFDYDVKAALQGIQALEFGFRDSFPAVAARLCIHYGGSCQLKMSSALHIGSGVGRGCFELSKHFDNVIGIDYAGRYVDFALKLKEGKVSSFVKSNGQVEEVHLDKDCHPERVTFKQLTWIPNEVGSHDLTLISFLNRTQQPKAWLVRLWEVTNPDGLVAVAMDDETSGQDELKPIIGQRLVCVGEDRVPYDGFDGQKMALITVWHHHHHHF